MGAVQLLMRNAGSMVARAVRGSTTVKCRRAAGSRQRAFPRTCPSPPLRLVLVVDVPQRAWRLFSGDDDDDDDDDDT
ncbi:hypothetical protein ST47_g5998 [Ascochyta rabiei]|uniref:Uncharacterized protein n=1 Tax=Didymella rabiei TaxID=5454 RepID=A0A163D2G0_DIDRA|nr:hypothetical protein ST47_g5998 [Ascochyta rabiei]